MEELASGETVCKENEAPEEESESTQERTETGGENVESAALPLEGVEEEDMDMEEDMSEDTEDAEEPEGNAGRRTGGNFAFCGCRHRTSRYDTFSDFRDGRNESREDHPLPCDLANTGDVDLIDIQRPAAFPARRSHSSGRRLRDLTEKVQMRGGRTESR